MTESTELKEIRDSLRSLDERLRKLEGQPPDGPRGNGKDETAKQFLLKKNVSSGTDKTFVLAYYLENFRDLEAFTVEEIIDAFREAKEPIPVNPNASLDKNVGKEYIMEADLKNGKKSWTLTNRGEKHVESDFGTT